jgi:hypothetical protein
MQIPNLREAAMPSVENPREMYAAILATIHGPMR